MKILVIGSGGREHAMIWKIAQSDKVSKIYCSPGNPGTAALAANIPMDLNNLRSFLNFVRKEKIDLTVVGPEQPLIDGITDLFRKNGLDIIGPSKAAAQIEGSKVFSKKLMLKYGIPTAGFAVFDDYLLARKYLKIKKYPLVIKAEGQCLGKGVSVCKNNQEAEYFLKKLMKDKIFGNSARRVVIEDCLTGQEVSFMVATDGVNFKSFIPSQDHKRINEGDRGPNTGGMGAYAPIPYLDQKMIGQIEKKIIAPTISAMAKEGNPYQGFLYPGLILTPDGPKVVEFNCRLGDPETQPLMVLLETDLIDIFSAIINKKVNNLALKWRNGAAVCVNLVARGYPGESEKGREIYGLRDVSPKQDLNIFQAATKVVDGKTVSSGGRVVGVTARGGDLRTAIRRAYGAIGKKGVHFSGMHFRPDIGRKGLKKNLWN